MKFRKLGKTGRQVSEIGLGCEHLDGKPYEQVRDTIDAALEQGVNILDVFMPGCEIREHIAKALGSRRGSVMIQGHLGSTDINHQYDISRDLPTVQKYFEDLLRIFGGYIDFGMMFFIDTEKDYHDVFDTGFAKYAEHLKKQGDIGHIGFSSHNPETAAKVIATGLPELMLFSINPVFDMLPPDKYIIEQYHEGIDSQMLSGPEPGRAELYKLCRQKDVGITVMKTLCAGKLLSAELTPLAKPMSAPQCIHYALSRPSVASVLLGCKTPAEVRDSLRYYDADESALDYSGIFASLRDRSTGCCVYCSHCQPCPADIDIAAVNRLLDVARLDVANIPASVRTGYAELSRGGSDCIGCGNCESRCPFGVPVIENMTEAEELLRQSGIES